jgi:hypothetical protein
MRRSFCRWRNYFKKRMKLLAFRFFRELRAIVERLSSIVSMQDGDSMNEDQAIEDNRST